MPAPERTVRSTPARASGWTRSDSGSSRQARTTWLSRKGACRRWPRISAACSRTRWSAAARARAARARASPGRWTEVGRVAARFRRTDTSASASPVSQRAAGPGRDQVSAERDASRGPKPSGAVRFASRTRWAAASRPVRYGVRASFRAARYTVRGTRSEPAEGPEALASAVTGRTRERRLRSIRRSARRAGCASRTCLAPMPVKWSALPPERRLRCRSAVTSEGPGSSVSGPSSAAYGSASSPPATTTWCRRGSAASSPARFSSSSRSEPARVARSLKVTASSLSPRPCRAR